MRLMKPRNLQGRPHAICAIARKVSWLKSNRQDIPNDILVERVRAAMGRVSGDHSAIEIIANNGIVTVGGEASANDLPDLLAALREVRGVRDMVSELRVQDEAID